MCTSFAVYSQRPIYGLNFDFPEIELGCRVSGPSGEQMFALGVVREGLFYETAGMNAWGLFSASQILVAPFEIVHSPGEDLVQPRELLSSALRSGQRIEDVLASLEGRRLGYTTERKGHQIYADRFGGTCILEAGPKADQVYPFREAFTVLTNSPVERERARSAQNLLRLGLDRYQIAREVIEPRLDCFEVEDGFEVLKRTVLTRGKFQTLCSIVFEPEQGRVHVARRRDFGQVETFFLS